MDKWQLALPVALAVVIAGIVVWQVARDDPPQESLDPADLPYEVKPPGRQPGDDEPDPEPEEPVTGTLASDWPVDGSHATYTFTHSWAGPEGASRTSWGNATWTFHNGTWAMECDGSHANAVPSQGIDRNGNFTREAEGDRLYHQPPHVELVDDEIDAGAQLMAWTVVECRMMPEVIVDQGPARVNMTIPNGSKTFAARKADAPGRFEGAGSRESFWHPETKLLLQWGLHEDGWSASGWLTSSDALLEVTPTAAPTRAQNDDGLGLRFPDENATFPDVELPDDEEEGEDNETSATGAPNASALVTDDAATMRS